MSNDDDRDIDETGLAPLPGAEATAPIDFTTFILSMSTSCMIQLGEIRDPEGRTAIDLESARHTIEILQMLDRKTEGNLSGEEDRMLAHVIADLRERYLAKHRGR
ncbi:DUF1844 domain-containing protein [Sandaracinus amylolyticus]|uniref:DUF1844 domain-containing protein n=1 Tax=Sandaracinus amylolyticus TaxID=927083 RepID=A0A0F6YKL8_9BACT|nr:DUF1844 domain-containing protein [Sandaracinus amylolyticus]AKF08945.1 hypothetical protein DB32_006094 [Sandaracinus amylolyticus]